MCVLDVVFKCTSQSAVEETKVETEVPSLSVFPSKFIVRKG